MPSNFTPSGNTPDASMALPASLSRHLPTASKFSIAKPIGSMRAWQLAHAGLARCWVIASRMDRVFPASEPSVFRAGIFGGGGGGGEESRFSNTHLPLSTGDVRVEYEVSVRMLPWPS